MNEFFCRLDFQSRITMLKNHHTETFNIAKIVPKKDVEFTLSSALCMCFSHTLITNRYKSFFFPFFSNSRVKNVLIFLGNCISLATNEVSCLLAICTSFPIKWPVRIVGPFISSFLNQFIRVLSTVQILTF